MVGAGWCGQLVMQNNLWVFCVVVTHGLGHGHAVPGIDPELRGAVGLRVDIYLSYL